MMKMKMKVIIITDKEKTMKSTITTNKRITTITIKPEMMTKTEVAVQATQTQMASSPTIGDQELGLTTAI